MITHNTFDYAQLGLTVARIGSQLKKGIKLNLSCSFAQNDDDGYCFVSLHDAGDSTCIASFYRSEFENIRSFMDAVFGYCIENDLFKQPLDIKLVD
jgi:hypothetical protein